MPTSTLSSLSPELVDLHTRVKEVKREITLERVPYDIGWWSRYCAFDRPEDPEAAEGWDDCDKEADGGLVF